MTIKYLVGDATSPASEGNKIIAHVCNDIGGWGKGFVMAISKKWTSPETKYREWHKSQNDFALGSIQLVKVESDLWIANMIGQRDIKSKNGVPPIRYDAIETCLKKLADEAKSIEASVHMPRIGCGLAGGKWEEIEPLLFSALVSSDIVVYVYDRG